MDINESIKNRSDLKSYFVKNAIPTENHFAELIDSAINQREDGLAKASGAPLSVEAYGRDLTRLVAHRVLDVEIRRQRIALPERHEQQQ